MSIKLVKACTIICDGCGKDFFDETEWSCTTSDQVDEWMQDTDWKTLGKKHYCEGCQEVCVECDGTGEVPNNIPNGSCLSEPCFSCAESGWLPKKGKKK